MQQTSISIRQKHFIDEQGRQVMLHGTGLVDKNPKTNYLLYQDPVIFKSFQDWGFNCVRLGVTWDGLEAEPGVRAPRIRYRAIAFQRNLLGELSRNRELTQLPGWSAPLSGTRDRAAAQLSH